jgi:hypothetical protein
MGRDEVVAACFVWKKGAAKDSWEESLAKS